MSMNGLPYYKAYPRDFIEGTIGMDFEVKGCYRLLLDLIYMQGGDLPDDSGYISGLLGCTKRKWNSLREKLISADKIQIKNGLISNYRAVIELETLRKLQDKQRENRSRPNKNNDLEKPRCDHTEPDTEPEEKREAKASPKKTGSRLSPNWQLPKDWGDWAVAEEKVDELSVRRQADRFRDYWIGVSGKAGVKLAWQATWRNWIRKYVEDTKTKKGYGSPQYGETRVLKNGTKQIYTDAVTGWIREYV